MCDILATVSRGPLYSNFTDYAFEQCSMMLPIMLTIILITTTITPHAVHTQIYYV